MGLESVTRISDLNAAWPLGTDERAEGDNHLRAIKTAVRSLLTDVNQIRLGPASLTGSALKVRTVNSGETAYEVQSVAALLALVVKRNSTYGGTITGSGVAWTLAAAPTSVDLLILVRNGVVQRQGAGHDFTISGASMTLATALDTNYEFLEAWYL